MKSTASTSSPTEIAPVIFPKPQAKDPDDRQVRSIHVLESVRRHRYIVAATLLLLLAAGGFVIYKRRGPNYEASSRIYISPTSSRALTDDKQQAAPYEGYLDEQQRTVTRNDVIAAGLETLPPATWRAFGPSREVAANVLEKLMTVAHIGQSFEITVSLDGKNARQVTDIVNAVVHAYIEKSRHEQFYDRDQKLSILRDEEKHLESQLEEKAGAQTALLRDLGIASVHTEDTSPYNEQLAKLHGDLNDATEQLTQAESKLQSLKDGTVKTGMVVAAQDAAAADPGLAALKSNLNAQRGQLVQQMATLTPSNPLYKADEDQIKTIDSQLAQNTQMLESRAEQQITDRLNSEILQKRIVVNRLRSQLLEQTRQATGSAPKYQQAQQLSADIDHLQAGYATVEERIRELEVDSSSPGSIYLSSPANVPLGPKPSKLPLLAMMTLIFSVGFSVAVAVAIDFFDPHLYNADDVKHVMGFAPLGVLLDHDHYGAEVSQQYTLRLAAGIHHAVRTSGARTFLFTATEPESGTTSVVEKLARQLRVLNLRTMTVAATNVDGKISYVSSAPAEPRRPAPIAPAAAPTGPADVAWSPGVPTSGPLALFNHQAEQTQTMFSGSFVAQVLSENAQNYDVVLVDGGPLLISADAEYLARIADGTIIVVQSGRTTRKQLERSATLLERLHVAGVAVALNRVSPQHADAALRQDVLDFQQQLKKQRGTALSQTSARRIAPERPRESPVNAARNEGEVKSATAV